MAGSITRSLFNLKQSLYRPNVFNIKSIHTTVASGAARAGTRAKARAKKVKVEIQKVGFIPHNQRKTDKNAVVIKKRSHEDIPSPISKDNVYPMIFYQERFYTVEEAVKAHRQLHHPTMLNFPDAFIYAKIEFNMQAVKKNRNLDSFTKMTLLPHPFQRDEDRTILVFCKGPEMIKQALEAGATTAGSTELIKKIQEGQLKVADYDFVLAHPNIMTDIVPIRGLMKKRYPNVRTGTLTLDIPDAVRKFGSGIQYRVLPDKNQPEFGDMEVAIGRLTMDIKQLEDNLEALLKDLQSLRPQRPGLFITRSKIVSLRSEESLRIDPFVYVEREISQEAEELSDDEGEDQVAIAKG